MSVVVQYIFGNVSFQISFTLVSVCAFCVAHSNEMKNTHTRTGKTTILGHFDVYAIERYNQKIKRYYLMRSSALMYTIIAYFKCYLLQLLFPQLWYRMCVFVCSCVCVSVCVSMRVRYVLVVCAH